MSLFKISLPGFRVPDASPEQEVVDSSYPSPKVDTLASPPHAGIITLSWLTSGLVYTDGTVRILKSFPHNYGYIPSVIGSFQYDNGTRKVNGIIPFYYGVLGVVTLDADSQNINLKFISTDLSSSVPIPPFQLKVRYYVFAERGHA